MFYNVKEMGELFSLSIFSAGMISFSCLGVFSERPDPGGAERMNQPQIMLYVRAGVMIAVYVLWMQESQALTSYNPPHHLNSHVLHTEGWRQDKKTNYWAILWARAILLCVCVFIIIIFLLQLSVSLGTSQQTVSADTALKHSAL